MKPSATNYQTIKDHILGGIRSGAWLHGDRIPSENKLANDFGMSRMTANRAIRELAAEGLLERVQGKGTYVTADNPLSSVLRIQGIADEIRSRGNAYRARVMVQQAVRVTKPIHARMGLPVGSDVATTTILHFENDTPMQLEQRWVNPAIAPEYLQQDFALVTPHEYLSRLAPLTRGEHTIEATLPDRKTLRHLKMDDGEPCLRIHRITWVDATVASAATLTHPGSRYQLQSGLQS